MKYSFNWSAVSGGAPYITLSSLGIALNSVSIDKLNKPKKIIVGFDEEHRALGIKAYNNEAGLKPYEFADRIRNGWVRIGCKDFIKYLHSLTGLDFSNSKKYVADFNSEEKILIVKILDATEKDCL